MKNSLRESAQSYFFGQDRIKSRINKLNITAFFLFQPNSNLRFDQICNEIKQSNLKAEDKQILLTKFGNINQEWKPIVIETLKTIDESLTMPDQAPSDSQPSLITQTTKLVIGGRTFESDQPSGSSLDIDDEIRRYCTFSFSEFVKCK